MAKGLTGMNSGGVAGVLIVNYIEVVALSLK